jgi:hypothetical protein
MNFEAGEEPRFSIGKTIDVMELDLDQKELGLAIHIKCWEYELQTEPIKEKVRSSVNNACNYLIKEGYIPNVIGWKVAVSVMGHPPTQNNNN